MAETEQTQNAQTETKPTTPEAKPAEKSKPEIRRENEKALRAAKKPDYRSAGVTLKVLKPNPKKPGSNAHAVFAKYADGMSVADLLASADKGDISVNGKVIAKSYVGACLMWDDRHGFIELVAAAKPEPKTEPVKDGATATEQPKA